MNNSRLPIGIFDSGIGGLTVLRAITRRLPNEDIVYFGDTARVPYGSKSRATINNFSRQIVDYLQKCSVKVIVIACNTASSYSYDNVRRHADIPVLSVTKPGVLAACAASTGKKIGVIATPSSVESGAYQRAFRAASPKSRVCIKSCPLLAPLVEEHGSDDKIADGIIAYYLKDFKGKIDTLLLGCTHYPVLKRKIQAFLGKKTKVIDSASACASALYDLLEKEDLLDSHKKKQIKYTYYVTDSPAKFCRSGSILLGKPITQARKAQLNV